MASKGIYHMHHIVPKYMGGTNDPSNLVRLTVEEHSEAHRKLYEQFGNIQDKLAWQGLSGMITKQELISELMSNSSSGENNPMFGRSAIKEQNLRWYTDGTENRYLSEGTVLEGWERGRTLSSRQPHSKTTIERISNSLKGRSGTNNLQVVSPQGDKFPSIKSAANHLDLTVSQFKYRHIENGNWVIAR